MARVQRRFDDQLKRNAAFGSLLSAFARVTAEMPVEPKDGAFASIELWELQAIHRALEPLKVSQIIEFAERFDRECPGELADGTLDRLRVFARTFPPLLARLERVLASELDKWRRDLDASADESRELYDTLDGSVGDGLGDATHC